MTCALPKGLTDFEVTIMALAHDGMSNRQIAASTGKPFNCIVTTLSNAKRKGFKLPDHRPLDATPEKSLERHDRKWQASPEPRYTATGTKQSTGERFEVTADSKAFADAHLAAMLGVVDG